MEWINYEIDRRYTRTYNCKRTCIQFFERKWHMQHQKNGLEVLSLTEHAPQMPGSCQEIYFRNFNVIPREMHGVKLLLGTELNIMNPDGDLDLSESLCRNLDIVIASIHFSNVMDLIIPEKKNTKSLYGSYEKAVC